MARPRRLWWSAAALTAAVVARRAAADDRATVSLVPRGGLIFAENRDAPGQTEGAFGAVAYGVDGAVGVKRARHSFALRLSVLEALGVTTVRPDAVKAADDVAVSARYELELHRYVVFYARVTSTFPAFGSGTAPSDLQSFAICRGDTCHATPQGRSLALTQPLLPLVVRQGAGVAVRPVEAPYLSLELSAGLGDEHYVAPRQLALVDDPRTRTVSALELETAHAFGPALGLGARGHVSTRLAYAADVEVRFPLAHSTPTVARRSSLGGLTEVAARHSLRLELVPWLTVDYDLVVDLRPLLVRGVTIENRLLLAARPWSLL